MDFEYFRVPPFKKAFVLCIERLMLYSCMILKLRKENTSKFWFRSLTFLDCSNRRKGLIFKILKGHIYFLLVHRVKSIARNDCGEQVASLLGCCWVVYWFVCLYYVKLYNFLFQIRLQRFCKESVFDRMMYLQQWKWFVLELFLWHI